MVDENRKIKIFSSDEMQRYLENFDVLQQKYFYWLDLKNVDENELTNLKNRIFKQWHQNDMIDRYNIDDAISTYLTLEKVYGKKYRADMNYAGVALPNLVTEKFLKYYINIQGADKLFNAKYFGFEWGMHMEYKEKNKDYSYYRDHYVHQIRNMYEMFVLLDDLKYRDLCKEIYSQNNGMIGEGIWQSIEKEIQQLRCGDEQIFEDMYKMYQKSCGELDLHEFKKEIYFHEIICSASVLAALVHDIGYPVTYMSRVADDLQDFIPIIRDFIDIRMNIPHIYAELEQSVLFRFVSHEIIEKKLKNKDHGALSAIILLKYYYNKGFIRDLSPVKKMTIELAAVMIFSHTLKYEIHNEKECDEVRPLFCENPLSFLFRLCDDIQEWDREYFEISFKHNYFICEKCHTMHYYDSENKEYFCCCNGSKGINLTGFLYRRLIQVNTSDEVRLEYYIDKDAGDRIENLVISIEYDLFKLLLMSNYSSKFAKIRAEEIRKIKKELSNQRYFPHTFVNCVITANPIVLKLKILEGFIGYDYSYNLKLRKKCFKDISELYDYIGKSGILSVRADSIIKSVKEKYEKWNGNLTEIMPVTTHLITDKIDFYVRLFLVGMIIQQNVRRIKIGVNALDIDDLFALILKFTTDPLLKKWDLSNSVLQCLCVDYLWQCRNEISSEQFFKNPDMQAYYDVYIQTGFISDEVRAYTNNSQYGNIVRKCIQDQLFTPVPIDFYSDLYMFYEMNEYIKLTCTAEDIINNLESFGSLPEQLKLKIREQTDEIVLRKWYKTARTAKSIEAFVKLVGWAEYQSD